VVFFGSTVVGKTIGKYQLVEKIGRGGMGVVYRAVDETLDRQVAIKAISPELVEDELVKRFRSEAVTLARVNHPNIATVYELFRDEDQLLMVMELVRGETFEQLIERSGALPVPRAAALVGQVLDALSHAHRAGIVHRDLKPSNLMLTENGSVKVMDFGIARVAGTERVTTDGLMVGTPAYMAPEQVRGDEVDGRADLYAVGVVFYRLLTGKLPFRGSSAVAMIQAQINDTPAPLREARPDLPDWLDVVLTHALAKRREDRFQTAEEFRRALTSVVAAPDDVTAAATPSPLPIASRAIAAPNTPAASAGPHGTTTLVLNRSHLAVAAAFGVLFVAAIGLLAWLAIRRPPAPVIVTPPPAVTVPQPQPQAPPQSQAPPASPPASQPQPQLQSKPPAPAPAQTTAQKSDPPIADSPSIGRRGGRGRAAAEPAARVNPTVAFQPVAIRDARALVILPNGRDSRLIESVVAFGEKAIEVTDVRTGFLYKSLTYDAVEHATLTRGRLPKVFGGADVQTPGGIPQGNVFTRGQRLWVTLETANDRLVLRLEPQSLRPFVDLVRQRTKAPVDEYSEPQKD
jgi:serine/threonine-protein kinase